ncbi:uncharacterized protein [Argopecten irradians]|uniref:uncharacterized protein n=1 Tax=Argopecten irradians TaxID=31199 RepID=UPI0037207193
MESSKLRPKSAKHNYRNRAPQPKSPKSRNQQVTKPEKSTEPDKTRLESARPKSAHPRAKSRRGIVVDIVNSQNSVYTDITVITNGRNTRGQPNLPDPGKSNLKRSTKTKALHEIGHGKTPMTRMAADNMKENNTNVQMVAKQQVTQKKTITRCYYRPLTPIITNEDEYYANLDPVDYFNDPTIQDLPIFKDKSKTMEKTQKQKMRSPSSHKEPPQYDEDSRPWSESIQEVNNKTLLSRKKYVNTKNSVYAMFFDEGPGLLASDTRKHVRPLTDDKVIMQSTKTIHDGDLVDNSVGVKKSRLTKVDGRRLLGSRANNTRGPPGSEKSWIPRYNGIAQNTTTQTTFGKPGNRDVKFAHVQGTKDPKSKYKYELRPFSEGINILAENEILRYRANQELTDSKYNVDKMLAKHKKKCGNFPNGFDLKPRRNNLVGPDQMDAKHAGAFNAHMTSRPRKLKPIQAVHNT